VSCEESAEGEWVCTHSSSAPIGPWAFKLPSRKKQEDPPETVDGDHGVPRKFPVKIPYVKAHQSRSRGFSKNML